MLAALAVPANALAAESTPTELAVARRLFDEAVALEKAGKWQLAADKLRAAIEVKDTPGLRFHLAHCEEKLGLLVEALLDYRRARDLIQSGLRAPDVDRVLGPAEDALEARVPLLVVVTPAGVENVRVELDGKALDPAILGQPAPINPGLHRIVAAAPGYREFVREVTLAEGQRESVNVLLQPSSVQEPAQRALPPARRAPAETPTNARTYVVVGEATLALAALGVGIAYRIVQSSARDRASSAQRATREASDERTACADPSSQSETLQRLCAATADAISDYHRARQISTAGFVTAGVSAAATVLTFVLWPDPGRPRVDATAGKQGMSLSYAWQF